jgi:hypothetical protein
MLAAALVALTGLGAAAQEQPVPQSPPSPAEERAAPAGAQDRFVISSDECGASQYRHLLGREFAQVYQTAMLPRDMTVQNGGMFRTLEYTPHRLRVVLGADGRIITIGCF